MVKVQLIYTQQCPHCPATKELFRALQKEYKFNYEEVDAMSEKGRELVTKHNIMAVPSVIVDGKLTFVGLPSKEKVIAVVTK